VLCLVRGLFRPNRAVAQEGQIQRCAGGNGYGTCDPADTLHSRVGESVYAVAPAEVVAVGETFLHLLVTNDNVILMYDGVVPDVMEGQHVGKGQRIGVVDEGNVVRFSVTALEPSDSSPLGYDARVVPPSGWLAARGAKHFVRNVGAGTEYCEGGRHITVPAGVNAACNMVRPEPGRFGLLPVNVDIQ
jgi:hypothetical protein